jgi:ATP phosphoribosyltransferase
VLRLVLPKGSLEKATLELFEAADLPVVRSSGVDYKATVDDPRISEVRILRPQEIPTYVEEGLFDIGITGRDWVEETASNVVSLGEMRYSKATSLPDPGRRRGRARLAGAVGRRPPARAARQHRVSRADAALLQGPWHRRRHPSLVRRDRGEDPRHRRLHRRHHRDRARATRRRAADHRHDPHELHGSDRERRSARDADKRHAMQQLMTLLMGTLDARGKVLVKMNVGAEQLDGVLALVPSLKAPTVNELAGDGGFAVETVVAKSQINTLIPALKDAGATGILELPISKIIA